MAVYVSVRVRWSNWRPKIRCHNFGNLVTKATTFAVPSQVAHNSQSLRKVNQQLSVLKRRASSFVNYSPPIISVAIISLAEKVRQKKRRPSRKAKFECAPGFNKRNLRTAYGMHCAVWNILSQTRWRPSLWLNRSGCLKLSYLVHPHLVSNTQSSVFGCLVK